MDKELIKRLREERAKRYNDAARKLLENDDVDGAKQQLTWVETSAKLLSSTQHATQRKWSVLILFICVVLAGLAWTLRIPSTHVTLDVTTGNVVLRLRDNWESNHQFVADEISIKNVAVDSYKNSDSLHIKGKEIVVGSLMIQKDAEVELSVVDHELRIFVKQAQLSGEISFQQAQLTIETEDDTIERSFDEEIPETITFKTAKVGAVPVELKISGHEGWRLRSLPIQGIGFVEEFPPNSGIFESVIRSGKVTVLETGVEEELQELDALIVKDAKSRRLELANTENGVQVIFEGTTSKILAGPQDFATNLTPTIFQYIYHQEKLKVFWGAVIFLTGLLWRVRNTLLS
jgi:hypothetical protein